MTLWKTEIGLLHVASYTLTLSEVTNGVYKLSVTIYSRHNVSVVVEVIQIITPLGFIQKTHLDYKRVTVVP